VTLFHTSAQILIPVDRDDSNMVWSNCLNSLHFELLTVQSVSHSLLATITFYGVAFGHWQQLNSTYTKIVLQPQVDPQLLALKEPLLY